MNRLLYYFLLDYLIFGATNQIIFSKRFIYYIEKFFVSNNNSFVF